MDDGDEALRRPPESRRRNPRSAKPVCSWREARRGKGSESHAVGVRDEGAFRRARQHRPDAGAARNAGGANPGEEECEVRSYQHRRILEVCLIIKFLPLYVAVFLGVCVVCFFSCVCIFPRPKFPVAQGIVFSSSENYCCTRYSCFFV